MGQMTNKKRVLRDTASDARGTKMVRKRGDLVWAPLVATRVNLHMDMCGMTLIVGPNP